MSNFDCHVRKGLEEPTRELWREACKKLNFYREHEGQRYCVLHYPGENKADDFRKALKDKKQQKPYNFYGTVFPEGAADFEGFKFDADANFIGATFVGEADFSEAEFSGGGTYFDGADFSGAWTSFEGAQFSDERTSFVRAKFSGGSTSFEGAGFSGRSTYFDDAQFSGAWTDFSEAEFSGGSTYFPRVQFSGAWTSFEGAQFSSEETSFLGAKFSGERTDFSEATFRSEQTDFSDATFNAEWTNFSGATFSGKETNFSGARFSSAYTAFLGAVLGAAQTENVDFRATTFREKVEFWRTEFGSQAWVWFGSHIEKPELLTFHTVLLHPGWFINADVRKIDFTDVMWYGMPGGPGGTLHAEIAALKARGVESPHTLLAQACRRLSTNAEENREYPLANEFHYWSMNALRIRSWSVLYEAFLKEEVRRNIKEEEQREITFMDLRPRALDVRALWRKDTWDRIRGRRRFGLVNSLYWLLGGYGVRAGRALIVLLTIAVGFAVLYMIVGHSSLRVLPFAGIGQAIADTVQAVMYSLGVMARLRPEPIPEKMGLPQILVTVEGILGPLQIALLALAIRRKVMR